MKQGSTFNPILTEFGKSILALTDLLQKDEPLDPTEQMFVEHHIEILRIVFAAWKGQKKS